MNSKYFILNKTFSAHLKFNVIFRVGEINMLAATRLALICSHSFN